MIDAVATIEDASGSATHIVCSPSSWADLSKFKQATDSNMSLVGAGTTAPTRTLLSVPVLVSNSMPDATMLVLDSASVLSVYGSRAVGHLDGLLLRLGQRRAAGHLPVRAKIADTDRVVKLTVAGAGS